MAITITRRLAQQLRAIVRRALGLTRSSGLTLSISRDRNGLCVRAHGIDAAVEFRDGTAGTGSDVTVAENYWLPLQFLDECQGKKDVPVRIDTATPGRASVEWRDGNVPQLLQYDMKPPADPQPLPAWPEDLVENPPNLLRALYEASETTDPGSARFALGCLRLRGEDGTIAASDGQQLLVQGGFHFPWAGDVLLPGNRIFGSSDLPRDVPVRIAKSGDWLVLGIGPWRLGFRINTQGRFPKLDTHVPRPEAASARCRLADGDAEFLAQTIPRLPCEDSTNDPVTVELNGAVVVRAHSADPVPPTEAIARHSTWEGEPLRVNTNRRYLARALRLGFRELCFFGAMSPMACFDGTRSYIWALLDHASAIRPDENATRIESPACEPPDTVPAQQARRGVASRPPAKSRGHDHVRPTGHEPTDQSPRAVSLARQVAPKRTGPQDLNALIERVQTLRASLRDALAKTNEVIRGLKQHRRAARTLESTLGAIRQIQTLRV